MKGDFITVWLVLRGPEIERPALQYDIVRDAPVVDVEDAIGRTPDRPSRRVPLHVDHSAGLYFACLSSQGDRKSFGLAALLSGTRFSMRMASLRPVETPDSECDRTDRQDHRDHNALQEESSRRPHGPRARNRSHKHIASILGAYACRSSVRIETRVITSCSRSFKRTSHVMIARAKLR
jgi:hypothetical protein